MSKNKKLILSFCSIIVIFVIYAVISDQKNSSIYDEDLMLKIEKIPDDQNAYFDLTKAAEKLYYPELMTKEDKELSRILYKGEWDEQIVKNILEKNQETLIFLERANKFSYFQDPKIFGGGYSNSENRVELFDHNYRFSNLMKINSLKAKYLAKNNMAEKSFEQLFLGAKIGRAVGDLKTKNEFIKELIELSGNAKLSTVNTKKYLSQLDNLKFDKEALKNVLKREYDEEKGYLKTRREGISYFSEMARYEGMSVAGLNYGIKFFLQPNKVRRIYAEHYREKIEDIEKGCDKLDPNSGGSLRDACDSDKLIEDLKMLLLNQNR